MKGITPFLWFNGVAKEAAEFYVSIFKNSKITNIAYYTESTERVSGQRKGTVMTVTFELDGQNFMALNGGSEFSFTPATSFMVRCDTQQELDEMWEKLTAGGQIIECGWLTDKFGVTWQVVPAILDELMKGADEAKKDRVMAALIKMKKLDIEKLKAA